MWNRHQSVSCEFFYLMFCCCWYTSSWVNKLHELKIKDNSFMVNTVTQNSKTSKQHEITPCLNKWGLIWKLKLTTTDVSYLSSNQHNVPNYSVQKWKCIPFDPKLKIGSQIKILFIHFLCKSTQTPRCPYVGLNLRDPSQVSFLAAKHTVIRAHVIFLRCFINFLMFVLKTKKIREIRWSSWWNSGRFCS